MNGVVRVLAGAMVLLGTGCSEQAPQVPPSAALPGRTPPPLAPRLAAMRALAAALPLPPSEARQRELLDLVDAALRPEHSDPRLAGRAERQLLEAADGTWALERSLTDAEPAVRGRAAALLARTGRREFLFPLLVQLRYEQDPLARVALADALQQLGSLAALPELEAAFASEATAEAAGQVAVALCARAGEPAGDPPTWDSLRAALRRLLAHWHATGSAPGEPPVPPPAADEAAVRARVARHLAVTEEFQLRPVDEARFALARSGTLGLPLLREALSASETYLRNTALQIVADLGRTAAGLRAEVSALLGDELSALYAVRALGAFCDAAAGPDLRAVLQAGDTELRAAAAHALGRCRDREALPALQAVFGRTDEPLDVRVQAAFALGRLAGDAGARQFLADLRERGAYHGPTLQRLLELLDEPD